MPTRLLRDGVVNSESIEKLSWFDEVFFYRLIVTCDDFGRYDARLKILKANLFPLKDVTLKQIETALCQLSTVGMVKVYFYDLKPYLQLVNWGKYQTTRNQRSKYPSIEEAEEFRAINNSLIENQNENEELQTIANNCDQLQENNIYKDACDADKTNEDSGFVGFWAMYPRKVGKGAAEKAFCKIKPSKRLQETILSAIESAKASKQWQTENGRYIPNPATWLNQKRWEDELESIKKQEVTYNDF